MPLEIIGTFSQGTLHGNAKITLADGKVVIANYINGMADGFRREWDQNGTLLYAGFYHSAAKTGRSWSKVGKSLVYEDVSTIDRSDDLSIVFPLEDSINVEVLTGNYWPHLFTLENVQKVEITETSLIDQSCFMTVKAKLASHSNVDNFIFDVAFDEMVQPFSTSDQAICEVNQKEGASVTENLVNWLEGVTKNLVIERKMRHIIFKMKAETGLPKSGGIKLVSNFVFNNEKYSPDPDDPPATFNLTFFEKEMVSVYGILVSFDANGELHGLAELLVQKSENFGMKYGFRISGVVMIQAFFMHGVINGPIVVRIFIDW